MRHVLSSFLAISQGPTKAGVAMSWKGKSPFWPHELAALLMITEAAHSGWVALPYIAQVLSCNSGARKGPKSLATKCTAGTRSSGMNEANGSPRSSALGIQADRAAGTACQSQTIDHELKRPASKPGTRPSMLCYFRQTLKYKSEAASGCADTKAKEARRPEAWPRGGWQTNLRGHEGLRARHAESRRIATRLER